MMASSPSNLEDQLRSMILGNVTIDPGRDQQTDGHGRGHHHDRYSRRGGRRGRFSHYRGGPDRGGPDRGGLDRGPQTWRSDSENPQPGPQEPVTIQSRPHRGHFHGHGRGRWGHGEHSPFRGSRGDARGYHRRGAPSKYEPLDRNSPAYYERQHNQSMYLERLASEVQPIFDMTEDEWRTKESFRRALETLCRDAVRKENPDDTPAIELATFGSFGSGFALPGSDMDLALLSSRPLPDMPRFLEQVLLSAGYGARLLSRTRVPILKICEKPNPQLMEALIEEREKWDSLTPAEQETYDKWTPTVKKEPSKSKEADEAPNSPNPAPEPSQAQRQPRQPKKNNNSQTKRVQQKTTEDASNAKAQEEDDDDDDEGEAPPSDHEQKRRQPRPWFREKRLGPLDFPKTGVGVQCDINFSTALGIHNTALLRCYSFCDIRVRLVVLFVKAWASKRKINNSRSGTLSSYGYVLMVLHFLVNIASPPICPNLQLVQLEREGFAAPSSSNSLSTCDGYDIRFWRDENELRSLAANGALTQNKQPLGALLRQFFQYYAHQHADVPHGGFSWTRDVLSLRTPGGLLSKTEKGWTGARTTTQENAEVRHRYLFAIEDPFELGHNVARTVTHNGIVAIRDEFRRAWRLIQDAGNGNVTAEGFMDVISDETPVRGDLRGDRDPEDLKNAPSLAQESKSLAEVDW